MLANNSLPKRRCLLAATFLLAVSCGDAPQVVPIFGDPMPADSLSGDSLSGDSLSGDHVAPDIVPGSIIFSTDILGPNGNITIEFAVSEILTSLSVHMFCGSATLINLTDFIHDSDTLTYQFFYQANGSEPEGPCDVVIKLNDLANNSSTTTFRNALVVDRSGPQVDQLNSFMFLSAPAGSLLTSVGALTFGGTSTLVLQFLEDLDSQSPIVRISGTTLDFGCTRWSDKTFFCNLTLIPNTTYPQGIVTVEVEAFDLAGNAGLSTLSAASLQFDIDTVPPVSPNNNVVALERTPWGTEAETTEGSALVAANSVVESCIPQAGTCDCCSWLGFYNAADLVNAIMLGKVQANASGDVPRTSLPFRDTADVYVVAIDSAGNLSDASPAPGIQAERVKHGVWTASFRGKNLESPTDNPHSIFMYNILASGRGRADLAIVPPQSEISELQNTNDVGPTVGLIRSWRSPTSGSTRPENRPWSQFVFNSLTEQALLIGADTFTSGQEGDPRDIWVWDDRWRRHEVNSSEPIARSSPNLVFAEPYGVIMHGGYKYVNFNYVCINDFWRWDGEMWRQLVSGGDVPPCGGTLIFDSNRNTLVHLHGCGIFQTSCPVWEWNGATWSSTLATGPGYGQPVGTYWPTLKSIVIFGGATNRELWSWNGNAWNEVPTGTTKPPAAAYRNLTYDASLDRLLLTGTNGIWSFSHGEWTHLTSNDPFAGVSYNTGTATFDTAKNEFIVFGGKNWNTWNYNIDWQLAHNWQTPPARQTGAATHDPWTKTILMFGGISAFPPQATWDSSTWEWDGSGFTQVSTTGPSGRHSLVLVPVDSPSYHGVLMHGGFAEPCDGNPDFCGTTWFWNGSQWTNITPTDSSKSPSPRVVTGGVYDPTRQVVTIFGGFQTVRTCSPGSGSTCGDVWEWGEYGSVFCGGMDIACWKNVTPASGPMPSPTGNPAGTFDPVNGIALFATYPNNVWGWDGVNWQPVPDPSQPSFINFLGHDSKTNRVMAIGSSVSALGGNELAFWNGFSWTTESAAFEEPSSIIQPTRAFDADRQTLFSFGGRRSPLTETTDEFKLLSLSHRDRPGIELRFRGDLAEISRNETQNLHVLVSARARSAAMSNNQPVYGVVLEGWNYETAEWESLAWSQTATNVFSQLEATLARANAMNLFGSRGDLRIRLRPIGVASLPSSNTTISIDYAEISVTYEHAASMCGNGVVEGNELCDDSDTIQTANGCTATCERAGFCGDNLLQSLFEECDPPNTATCGSHCEILTNPCCAINDAPGCSLGGDLSVETCVCLVDNSCCTDYWDHQCVVLAQAFNCTTCN